MSLAISVIVSGISFGLVIGIVGFGLVFLYKTTGVANFAVGNMAMFETFIVYELWKGGIGIWPSVAIGMVLGGVFALLVYLGALRPFDGRGNSNLLVRTVALYLLLRAMADVFFGSNQPYNFPQLLPHSGFSVGPVDIAWADLITIGIILAIGGAFAAMFRFTDIGLQLTAVSQNAPIARLLGVRVRRLSALAYVLVGMVALVAGLLVAPKQLLSSNMMDPLLLYGFAAAVVGGLTSLGGVFVGGIVVGVVTNLVSTYVGGDLALASAFVLLLATLAVRPHGLFGSPSIQRL